MKRRPLIAGVLLAVNLPWGVFWWQLSAPDQVAAGSVSALYLVLVLAAMGLIVLPAALIGGLFPRRWLLIVLLSFVNLFWGLRWIEAYSVAVPGDVTYGPQRFFFVFMILVSSFAALAVYRLAGVLLDRAGRPKGSRTAANAPQRALHSDPHGYNVDPAVRDDRGPR